MGNWGPIGATAGVLLGSAAGAIVNASMSPEAVMAYGWRIPFILGLGVGLGGLAIRRHYIERVPHQAPAKSPLREAFRVHWRTMLHLVMLVAGISVGFYTTFAYAATWLEQVAQVPARTALTINTIAMALSLFVLPAAASLGRLGWHCWSRRTEARCPPSWPSWRPGGCGALCSRSPTMWGWRSLEGRRPWSPPGWSSGPECRWRRRCI
jgi:MFS family permease